MLEDLNGLDKILLLEEDVLIRKRCDATDCDSGIGQRFGHGRQHADLLGNVPVSLNLQTSPANFLLNVVRCHELRANDRQFILSPRCETHVPFREDHWDLAELWQLADAELVFEEMNLEVFFHGELIFRSANEVRWNGILGLFQREEFSISPSLTQAHLAAYHKPMN
jgi:hypothetical protein